MKLFTKIFLCSITVVTAVLALLGYLMISGSFQSALERERANCLDRFRILKFTLQSSMLSFGGELDGEALADAADKTVASVTGSDKAAVLTEEGKALSSSFPASYSFSEAMNTNEDDTTSVIDEDGGGYRYTLTTRFTESGETVVLVYSRSINSVFDDKRDMERRFFTAYVITEAVAALVIAGLSLLLTRPINHLTRSTRRFARGNMEERSAIRSGDEIGELAESFNRMAEKVGSSIKSLELSAKQKDDFTASFAHELKTPLTSVIGYADMLYQRNELTRDEVREAAGFILNEGMRLEALSLKLMELFVLDKQDFTLMEMDALEVLGDIAVTMKPVLEKKGAELTVGAEKAYISIEFDLFKTLVMNLIDNAAKADGKHITLTGRLSGDEYLITVEDDGRGIPPEVIERITEAFYMVDKSRSRREHGAGLGLAIASRIAGIHGTKLDFSSVLGEGTKVTFTLRAGREAENE